MLMIHFFSFCLSLFVPFFPLFSSSPDHPSSLPIPLRLFTVKTQLVAPFELCFHLLASIPILKCIESKLFFVFFVALKLLSIHPFFQLCLFFPFISSAFSSFFYTPSYLSHKQHNLLLNAECKLRARAFLRSTNYVENYECFLSSNSEKNSIIRSF